MMNSQELGAPTAPDATAESVVRLANRLKDVRKFRGRTQEKVSELIAVNYRHLQKIEGGRADFKLSTLSRLAALFEIQPCFLANTAASELFRKVALPCQSLMLDAIPLGILIAGPDGVPVYRNRRAQDLLDRYDIVAELVERAPKEATRSWTAGSCSVEVRELGGRHLFLLDNTELPFSSSPLGLAHTPELNLLAAPAENMRACRHKAGMTQTAAANALDMNLRYYQKLESGKLDMKCSTLAKVAKVYAVKPCQLLVNSTLRASCSGAHACHASLLDRLPFGVMALDSQGELAYSNDAYHDVIGIPRNPESQKFYWDLFSEGKAKDESREAFAKLFSDSPPPKPYFREVVDVNGEMKKFSVHWDFLLAENGRKLGVVGLARPI